MHGTAVLSHLLAVALPVVITVSFNSGAPHYIAYHQDAEPVEICDWLSSCASPAWHDSNNTLRCSWTNGTKANTTATPSPPGTDVPPECPDVTIFAGPDVLRIVGGLVYPVPAAVSVCCLVISWFNLTPRVRSIGMASSVIACMCCLVLMILYCSSPTIDEPGWEVIVQSPGTWVAVRTSFAIAFGILQRLSRQGVNCVGEATLLSLCECVMVVPATLAAAAHRIRFTGEWGFAISSAAISCIGWPVWCKFAKDTTVKTQGFLLLGPGAFAILTAVYFGTTPTHTPLTSFWLTLGDPGWLGYWNLCSYMFVPYILGSLLHTNSLKDVRRPPWDGLRPNPRTTRCEAPTPDTGGDDADDLEMGAASSSSEAGCGSCGEESDDDELEEEEEYEEEEGAGGCEAADGDAGDGMPVSLRLPTGDVAVVCVAERASLGDLRRRALREVLSAASGGGGSRGDGTAWRVHLSSGGVRLRGPAHTPLHTLTLESGCVVEVCAEALPPHPASLSDAQSDLLQAVREGDAARTAQLMRCQGRYPDMFHDSEGAFAKAYGKVLPEAPPDVLCTLLRQARPTEACSVILAVGDRIRLNTLARQSGVLRRPAVMACVAEKAEPWVLYRLQQCTRRDLGFGVSLEEAVVAVARHWVPRVGHRKVARVLPGWGMRLCRVSPAGRSALLAEEPPLWVPCLGESSHPFSAVLLASGVPLGEVPEAVTALRVVCVYTAVCAVCVVGVAYAHAAFQMVDDNSAWMTVVFVAVSGPFFLFDLLPDWVQCELVCRVHRWWHRHRAGATGRLPELHQGLLEV